MADRALWVWGGYKRLTRLSFPRSFPIVQFPNVPLIVAFVAGLVATHSSGNEHTYARSIAFIGLTIWAYEELVHGVNWFRRLLGAAYVVIVIVRVAHAIG